MEARTYLERRSAAAAVAVEGCAARGTAVGTPDSNLAPEVAAAVETHTLERWPRSGTVVAAPYSDWRWGLQGVAAVAGLRQHGMGRAGEEWVAALAPLECFAALAGVDLELLQPEGVVTFEDRFVSSTPSCCGSSLGTVTRTQGLH